MKIGIQNLTKRFGAFTALNDVSLDVASGELDEGGVALGYDHVVAGLLAASGVDPDPWLPGVTPMGGFHDAA